MKNPRVYKFLHLPVQSGDNGLLTQMNRGYTTQDFFDILTAFRHVFPSLSLSTDIIVGFPGETDEQFHRSIDLLQKIKPDFINITRYSARPYTTAKKMKQRIPTEIVKERSRLLSSIAQNITMEKNKSFIGQICEVLLLEREKPGSVMGRTDTYKPVVIQQDLPLGTTVSVRIQNATASYLIGILK
jgi:MiaB/RimO family radical SAM methylthiotransferase